MLNKLIFAAAVMVVPVPAKATVYWGVGSDSIITMRTTAPVQTGDGRGMTLPDINQDAALCLSGGTQSCVGETSPAQPAGNATIAGDVAFVPPSDTLSLIGGRALEIIGWAALLIVLTLAAFALSMRRERRDGAVYS